MQNVARLLFADHVDGIEQALKVSFFHERRSDVGHDEIAHEQDAQVGEMHEHGVVGLAALHRNQLDARSANLQLRTAVDKDVRFEGAHIVDAEPFPEELLVESCRRSQFARPADRH